VRSNGLKIETKQSHLSKNKPKKQSVKRSSVTPDTGTRGENANRYRALKEAIGSGETKPTQRGIMAFKFGGIGMGRTTADKYRNALIKEGVIS
jgi:hypothetical protein